MRYLELVSPSKLTFSPTASAREALEFFASVVTEQAAIDHVHLSDLEKDMLLFSEVADTPVDPSIAAPFAQQYNSDAYEAKIIKLLSRARARQFYVAKAAGNLAEVRERWSTARKTLPREDYYLNVMVEEALKRDARWFLMSAMLVILILTGMGIAVWLHEIGKLSRSEEDFIGFATIMLVYALGRWLGLMK